MMNRSQVEQLLHTREQMDDFMTDGVQQNPKLTFLLQINDPGHGGALLFSELSL